MPRNLYRRYLAGILNRDIFKSMNKPKISMLFPKKSMLIFGLFILLKMIEYLDY